MKKILIPISLSLLITVFFVSFIELDNTSELKEERGIVYSVVNIPNNLSKVTNLKKNEEDFICATSKGLVEKTKDGTIFPSLASEVNVKDDGLEYEFILKDDISWSNGEKITSSDISKFFSELIKVEDESNIDSILNVYGAKDFRNDKVSFEEGVAIATTENSIKFRLNRKNEEFVEALTKPQYRVRRYLPLWEDLSISYSDIVYSGSYSISSLDDNEMTLSKNEYSKVEGPIEITVLKDDTEELAMASFEIGNRDIVLNPPQSQLNRLKEDNKLITLPSDKGIYINLNGSVDNLSLQSRREIYKIIYDAAEGYEGENSCRVEVAEGSYFRDDKNDLSKLQTRKVSINQEGEWKKPDIITILALDDDDSRDFCKYLSQYFKDKEGINLRYSLVKEDDLKDIELQKRYDLLLFAAESNTDDRLGFYRSIEGLYSEGEEKLFKDELAKDTSNFSAMEENLFNTYRILPVMFSNNNIAISDKVSNIEFDGHGNIDFSSITK